MQQLKNFPLPRQNSTTAYPLLIKTNLLPVSLPSTPIHYYSLTFEPTLNKNITHSVFTRIVSQNPLLFPTPLAFDSVSILVTREELPFKEKTIEFVFSKTDTFKLTISHKHTLSLDSVNNHSNNNTSLAVQCFEIISRQHQLLSLISEGRKAFSSTHGTVLSKGLQVYTGITHCLKLTLKGPLLNVDTAFSVFFEEVSLISFILKTLSRRSGGGSKYGKKDNTKDNSKYIKMDSSKFNSKDKDNSISREDEDSLYNITPTTFKEVVRVLKGVKMTTTHRERNISFKICDITVTPASETFFEICDRSDKVVEGDKGVSNTGNEQQGVNNSTDEQDPSTTTKHTVAEYFATTYSPLKYPFLPCVVVKKRDKVFYLPIEVVKICPNQKYIRKLDETQTSEMIKIAALPPNIRFSVIKERLEDMNICNNNSVKDFNISYGKDFVEVKGRQLGVPGIQFGNTVNNPVRGSWNLKGVTAVKPINIIQWAVLLLTNESERGVSNYISSLVRICNNFGVKLSNNYKIITCDSPKKYMEVLSSNKYKFCIVILKDRNSSVYGAVKKLAETVYGVITQCIRRVNLEKCMDPTFCSNIAIKINAKLGGVNHKLSKCISSGMFKGDTIVFGADVNHPGIGDLESPSIVAVVASLDTDLTSYSTIMRTQTRRQEIIENLKDIVREMLIRFKSSSSVFPKRIVFFRDGVGESQFYSVFESEICSIKEACKSLDGKYEPEVIFIVAQKRHSIRFMVGDGGKGNTRGNTSNTKGNTGNVSPGTCVQEVGHPLFFDFYLVSHYALQGTARPVRYQVLYDDSKLGVEVIQEYIHSMCYLYARATKAVSVVPPIYYAHLAAARAKCYIDSDNGGVIEMKRVIKSLENSLFYL